MSAVRPVLGLLVAVIGAGIAALALSMAISSVPREACDWARNGAEVNCSDYGPIYWTIFGLALAVTVTAIRLVRRKR